MFSEIFSTLSAQISESLRAGHLAQARNLAVHCADLPLNFLQLTKLNNLSKKMKSQEMGAGKKIRLALVASSTTDHLREALRSNFALRGFEAEVYESPFDNVEQEILDLNSGLYQFKPTHIILWLTKHDIALEDQKSVDQFEGDLRGLWETLGQNLPQCQIIQTTLVTPAERILGGLEHEVGWSVTSLLSGMNKMIRQDSGSAIRVLDLDWLSSLIGKHRWQDDRLWFHSKHSFNFDALATVSNEIVRIVGAMSGQSRKCLVLDLDNTLWGGVIGDDGLGGIQLGEGSIGEAFVSFQTYVKQLKKRGVVLAVCSKNNLETAKEPFRHHQGMVLKEEDISLFVANWENKADNIRHIAQTLDIGLDSIVFVDDNPVERKIVRDFLPEVYTVELPLDPSNYVEALDRLGLFELVQISDEDFKRTEQYRANGARSELKTRVGSLNDFLKSLEMRSVVQPIGENNWERAVQLINKSNQFNLLTNRYTPTEFKEKLKAPHWIGLTFRLEDRFGDNGLIAVLTTTVTGSEVSIEDWVMSCRVLSRGMESFTLNALVDLAIKKGCKTIVGKYRATKKNALVAELLPGLGFQLVDKSHEGAVYQLELLNWKPKSTFIKFEPVLE